MDTRYRLALVAVLGLAVLVGVLVGGSQSNSAAAPNSPQVATPIPTPAPAHVNIVPSSAGLPPATYQPAVLTIHLGQSVTWVNRTDIDHNVTADNSAFNSDVIDPGQSYKWTPSRAGKYAYGDFSYPEMRGEIDVSP